MYVRKFEAESLEQALKNIKLELGPDAIILKTVTNKGLKGAFKKNKIEITAAISEKNYSKKARVDNVLTADQKNQFYQSNSSLVSNMIDEHADHASHQFSRTKVTSQSYGKAGLNKAVQKVQKTSAQVKSGLDSFLSSHRLDEAPVEKVAEEEFVFEERYVDEVTPQVTSEFAEEQKSKIDELEKKLFELTKNVERFSNQEPEGIYQLRTTLKSFNVNEKYIADVSKKAMFEFSQEDLQSDELVFEMALRDMITQIKVEMPLFSSLDADNASVITVLLSDTQSGQTSMVQKLGALKENCVIIKNVKDENSFSEKIFNMQVINASGIPEIISETRKAVEAGKSVFIDYKNTKNELNETKKFIDGLNRAFDKVEALISLSAIHSELYNRRVIERYKQLTSGIVVSGLDLCLDFGSIFNLAQSYQSLPLKFFGTGDVVPDDIETATAERVIAGLFKFN